MITSNEVKVVEISKILETRIDKFKSDLLETQSQLKIIMAFIKTIFGYHTCLTNNSSTVRISSVYGNYEDLLQYDVEMCPDKTYSFKCGTTSQTARSMCKLLTTRQVHLLGLNLSPDSVEDRIEAATSHLRHKFDKAQHHFYALGQS